MYTQHINTRLFLLLLLAFLLTTGTLGAQGFIKQYPFFAWSQGGGQGLYPQAGSGYQLTALAYPDFGTDVELRWLNTDAQGNLLQTSVLTTPNSGSPVYGNDIFLMENGGYYRAYTDSNWVEVNRFNATGGLEWSQTYSMTSAKRRTNLINVVANDEAEVFVRGFVYDADTNSNNVAGFLLKFAPDGALLWEAFYPFAWTYVIPCSILTTPDGGCIFNNYGVLDSNGISEENILRFEDNGQLSWFYGPNNGRLFPGFDGPIFDRNSADHTFLFSYINTSPTTPAAFRLDHLDPAGGLIDSIELNTLLGKNNLEGQLVLATADGGAVVVVQQYLLNSWTNYIAKIQADGSLAWQRPLGFLTDAFPVEFYQGKEMPDGSFALYAYQGSELYLIKFSAEGAIYPHRIDGQIVRDSTFNCIVDAFDAPLKDWVVQATGNGFTQFATSGADGRYSLVDVDNGDYQIILVPPSYLWEPCLDSVQLNFNSSTPIFDTLDFPIQSLYDCPLMEVDIATPFLRRCFQNIYAVNYCNAGNQAAEPAQITVLFDPLLLLDSASIPYTQNGQLLTFDLGNVPAGECGSFKIYTTGSCAAEIGQTLCVEAHIYPDTICAMNVPNWSGAQIEVSTECAGDSVLFQIHNTGQADMPEALDFIIVDDHVITRQGMFQLPAGGIHEEAMPADGSTWRLIAEQEPGFPLGPQPPTVGVEACLAGPQGPFSMGMLNMFPNYTGNPFHDVDCRTVIGSWDPNDKQALPVGVDAPHFIDQNQPIEYLIRFQNTGTDTAFTVVIRDTLSAGLSPASIRMGASSHPYQWELDGTGILTITFPNILLPDSNANEPASHGFVQFRIQQQRDNPLGTILENTAAIYFDFNAPVITNTVFHTVGKDFLLTAAPERKGPIRQIQLYPNPARLSSFAQLDDLNQAGRRLVLRDISGRLVQEWPVQYLRQEIPRSGLPAGLYWLELREQGQLIAVGKLIWMD